MPLLNYSTDVPASRSIAEITRILQDSGASAIMLENGVDHEITAISFVMVTTFGKLPFTLPANIGAVIATLNKQISDESEKIKNRGGYQRKIPKSLYNNKAQAERIAWRIAKDWLEAQIALATVGSAKFEQIMLPFAQIGNKSFYQRMVDRGNLTLMESHGDFQARPAAEV
jgi:hypothetical protein